MRLTRYTDYGLRVLMYLAAAPDGFGTISDISNAYGISRNHLMKVVQALSRDGYVCASRGRGGGLCLGAPADRINLGAVVRSLEGEFTLVECFGADNSCAIAPACELKGALEAALRAFLAVLDGYTLADLNRPTGLRRLIPMRMTTDAGFPFGGTPRDERLSQET